MAIHGEYSFRELMDIGRELVRCERCEELYPDEEIEDQCGCRDDGSGQYVVDLPGFYCPECHRAYHEGWEE